MTLEERAKTIAGKANECCNRSDGYEEAIYQLALKHLKDACEEAINDYVAEVEDCQ